MHHDAEHFSKSLMTRFTQSWMQIKNRALLYLIYVFLTWHCCLLSVTPCLHKQKPYIDFVSIKDKLGINLSSTECRAARLGGSQPPVCPSACYWSTGRAWIYAQQPPDGRQTGITEEAAELCCFTKDGQWCRILICSVLLSRTSRDYRMLLLSSIVQVRAKRSRDHVQCCEL